MAPKRIIVADVESPLGNVFAITNIWGVINTRLACGLGTTRRQLL